MSLKFYIHQDDYDTMTNGYIVENEQGERWIISREGRILFKNADFLFEDTSNKKEMSEFEAVKHSGRYNTIVEEEKALKAYKIQVQELADAVCIQGLADERSREQILENLEELRKDCLNDPKIPLKTDMDNCKKVIFDVLNIDRQKKLLDSWMDELWERNKLDPTKWGALSRGQRPSLFVQ